MDIFYGTTFNENITAFKKDIKRIALSRGYDFGKKKLYVALGNPEAVGKCILVIGPPVNSPKPFQDKASKYLFDIGNNLNIEDIVLTSCYLVPLAQVSKNDIKDFNPWIEKLTDIFRPKLIVVLGEDAQFSFVKRKHILRDYHGQVIAKSNSGINVVLTYPMSYYLERSEYEDPSYKKFILEHDWEIIRKLYKGE